MNNLLDRCCTTNEIPPRSSLTNYPSTHNKIKDQTSRDDHDDDHDDVPRIQFSLLNIFSEQHQRTETKEFSLVLRTSAAATREDSRSSNQIGSPAVCLASNGPKYAARASANSVMNGIEWREGWLCVCLCILVCLCASKRWYGGDEDRFEVAQCAAAGAARTPYSATAEITQS